MDRFASTKLSEATWKRFSRFQRNRAAARENHFCYVKSASAIGTTPSHQPCGVRVLFGETSPWKRFFTVKEQLEHPKEYIN